MISPRAAVTPLLTAVFAAMTCPADDSGSRALQGLAASLGSPSAAADSAPSARAHALLTHAAHAFLTRAATLDDSDADGTITALTAMAIIPQVRERIALLEAQGGTALDHANAIVGLMEDAGLDGIRSLTRDASGWECDAALAALVEPTRPLFPWAANGNGSLSPWPGTTDQTPLALLDLLVQERADTDSPWSRLSEAVSAWTTTVTPASASREQIQLDAHWILDADELQRSLRHAPVNEEQWARAVGAAIDRWMAAVAERNTRAAALSRLDDALPALSAACQVLRASAALLPPNDAPARTRDACAKAHFAAVTVLRAKRTALADAIILVAEDDCASPALRTQLLEAVRACDQAATRVNHWVSLDAATQWLASKEPRLARAARNRAADADTSAGALLTRCCPFPGEDDGPVPNEAAFWNAASRARSAWLEAMTKRTDAEAASRERLLRFVEVCELRAFSDRGLDARAIGLISWGGWSPAPFGQTDDLPRLRGAIAVAMEDLAKGPRGEITSQKALLEAHAALPEARLARAITTALGDRLGALPSSANGPLGRVFLTMQADPILGRQRADLERAARLRLEEHDARRRGDHVAAAAARAQISAIADRLSTGVH